MIRSVPDNKKHNDKTQMGRATALLFNSVSKAAGQSNTTRGREGEKKKSHYITDSRNCPQKPVDENRGKRGINQNGIIPIPLFFSVLPFHHYSRGETRQAEQLLTISRFIWRQQLGNYWSCIISRLLFRETCQHALA